MTVYAIVLFLHIMGALGFFVALGLEWISLLSLRRASTNELAREWLRTLDRLRWVGPASMGLLLLSGAYMMHTVWGAVAWIIIALAAMVLMVVPGVFTGRRLAALGRAIASESGALSPAFRQRLLEPILWASIQTRVGIAVGIVFLMTVKPGLREALLTIGLAVILGLVSAWPVLRGQPKYQEAKNEI